MAIVGRPDLGNYRARLELIQEQLISGSVTSRYQIGGNPNFPQWINTITIEPNRHIDVNKRIWLVKARFFLARSKMSESTFTNVADLIDDDIITVLSYFDGGVESPFIVGTYTSNQPGYQHEPINITGTSPATYPISNNIALVGSSYELSWSHMVNYRAMT